MLPAVGRVKQHARATACLSHVRQIGAGFLLYADANVGALPAAAADDVWDALLRRYVESEAHSSAPATVGAKGAGRG